MLANLKTSVDKNHFSLTYINGFKFYISKHNPHTVIAK